MHQKRENKRARSGYYLAYDTFIRKWAVYGSPCGREGGCCQQGAAWAGMGDSSSWWPKGCSHRDSSSKLGWRRSKDVKTLHCCWRRNSRCRQSAIFPLWPSKSLTGLTQKMTWVADGLYFSSGVSDCVDILGEQIFTVVLKTLLSLLLPRLYLGGGQRSEETQWRSLFQCKSIVDNCSFKIFSTSSWTKIKE